MFPTHAVAASTIHAFDLQFMIQLSPWPDRTRRVPFIIHPFSPVSISPTSVDVVVADFDVVRKTTRIAADEAQPVQALVKILSLVDDRS